MAVLGSQPKPVTATASDRHDQVWTKIEKYRGKGSSTGERNLMLQRQRLRRIGLSKEILAPSYGLLFCLVQLFGSPPRYYARDPPLCARTEPSCFFSRVHQGCIISNVNANFVYLV